NRDRFEGYHPDECRSGGAGHRHWPRGGRPATAVQVVLHDEGERLPRRALDQPFDCRIARRATLGRAESPPSVRPSLSRFRFTRIRVAPWHRSSPGPEPTTPGRVTAAVMPSRQWRAAPENLRARPAREPCRRPTLPPTPAK